MRRFWNSRFALPGLALMLAATAATATDSLEWRVKDGRVDADIQSWNLPTALKKISKLTGWKVYVEKGADTDISVKFKNLPEDEALHRMLGKLTYAKDKTNGMTRLLVFRTAARAATQLVAEKKDYRIPNEAMVKLKKGATNSIDDLAKALGAKVTYRKDKIGLYDLQFADAASANAGMQALASDPSVGAVDNNYVVDRPAPAQMAPVPNASGPSFNLNPQPSANGPVVGLVDTSVDPPSQYAPYMLTPINETGQTGATATDAPSHGTSMLETLLEGMPSDPSRILPVDVYGNSPSTTTVQVIGGIVDAINAGANPINLSLGGTGDSAMLQALISEGVSKGIVFVAAAGNTPGEGEVYPADYTGVISVTASTQTVTGPVTTATGGNTQLASYANDPPDTKAIAPGTSYVTWNGQTWVVEGTSTATAATTGTIAGYATQNGVSVTDAANIVTKVIPAPRK